MAVPGYLRLEGDCGGHDIKQIDGTRRACGKECDQMPTCMGYLYILPGEKKFPYPPCFLKKKMCEKPSFINGLDISAYFKNITQGKSL